MRARRTLVAALAAVACTLGLMVAAVPAANAASGPIFTVMNTSESPPDGVYFRNSPHTADTSRTYGLGVFMNERVQLQCYAFGDAVGPYSDSLWYYVNDVTRPTNNGQPNVGFLNAHYINDGQNANVVDAGVPACVNNAPPTAPPPAPTPTVTLAQGPAAPAGYRYAITLAGFPGNSSVPISCRDSVSPSGFYIFSLATNASGQAFTQSYCYSGDGPDHWVTANGVESNHVRWGGGSGGGSTGGGTTSGAGAGGTPTGGSNPSVAPPTNHPIGDSCIARYPKELQQTRKIFGGTETRYDRQASLYQVCEGFGLPGSDKGPVLSPSMKCALIAAAATYGGPVINTEVSRDCGAVSVISDLASGQWANASAGVACDYFGGIFAEGVGIFIAGAASGTGPGAAAIGVKAYRALAAGLKVACGGIFDGGAAAFGKYLETHHEVQVAVDITRHRKCLRQRTIFGQIFWSAASCA